MEGDFDWVRVHRDGACGDGRKNKDDRDEFGCELTREKCAATFSLIGAGRGAVRVVATTQPVWDRPSGNKITLPSRQDGTEQYDTTVAFGDNRDQTFAKICTAPGVCTCPPKVRHAVKLQGVPAAALKKRECELLRSAVDGFGKDEEGWKYKPDRTREEREQELDKSLLDLLDGKETKDKETKETKRAGDGLRAALPDGYWLERATPFELTPPADCPYVSEAAGDRCFVVVIGFEPHGVYEPGA